MIFLVAPSGLVQGQPGALASPELDHEVKETARIPRASASELVLRDLGWGKKEREREREKEREGEGEREGNTRFEYVGREPVSVPVQAHRRRGSHRSEGSRS